MAERRQVPNVPTNDPGVRIEITDNRIFGNGALGIDLGDPGITPNDPLDADGRANLQQTFLSDPIHANAPGDVSLPLQPDSLRRRHSQGDTQQHTNMLHRPLVFQCGRAMHNESTARPAVGFGRQPVTTGADGNGSLNFQLNFPRAY